MKKKLFLLTFLINQLSWAQQSGSLDLTFNNTGFNLLNINGNDNAQALAIAADSSIYIAGTVGTSGNLNIGVKRILPDGTADASFGNIGNGAYIYDHLGLSDFCYDMAIQADGKIVLAGAASLTASNTDFLAIRLLPNGTIDNSFGTNGVVVIAVNNSEDYARSVIIQPDGKIVLAGSSATPGFSFKNAALARLNTDGSLDTTFGINGISVLSVTLDTEEIESFVQLSNGDFRAVGKGGSLSVQNMVIFGILNDGNIDPNFGTNGYISSSQLEYAYDITQSFNQLYIAGKAGSSGAIYRTDINGNPLSNFGTNGVVIANLNADLVYLSIKVLQDSSIIVGGSTTLSFLVRDMIVARFHTNGAIDTNFGTNGNAVINTGGFEDVNDLGIQSDGKIVGCALSSQTGGNDMCIFRLDNQIITSTQSNNALNLSLYPNPINSNQVHIKNLNGNNAWYQISDIQGKIIQTGYTNGTINIGDNLSKGIFCVSINANNAILNFKLIK
jgi:uncharacterized delta-60 repeat protein